MPLAPAGAAAGTLDVGFGRLGVASADFGGTEIGTHVGVGPKAKLVVLGFGTSLKGPGAFDLVVARFTKKGKLDRKTFGKKGRVRINAGHTEIAGGLAVQPDGKVVVAATQLRGLFTQECCNFAVLVARLTKKGKLDKGFGEDGIVTVELLPTTAQYEIAVGVVLQPDGGIVVGGTTETQAMVPGTPPQRLAQFMLMRFDEAGALDPTFGAGGIALANSDGAQNRMTSLTSLEDGSIVAVGTSTSDSTTGFLALRTLPNGVPDPTFGSAGWIHTDFGTRTTATAVRATAAGGFVVAGGQGSAFQARWAVARHRADGSLHTGFSGNGRKTLNANGLGYPTAVELRKKRVYVSGTRIDCSFVCIPGGAVGRLKMGGALDKKFGWQGWATVPLQMFGTGTFTFRGSKLLLSGYGVGAGSGSDMLLARFDV